MLGDSDTAYDAVQASFVRAYKGLRHYRHGAEFSTWLYRIVVNVCLDLGRRKSRIPAASIEAEREEGLPELGETIADGGSGPEERLLQQERARAVQAALLRLTPHYRAVLVLYELQGMGYEDVARVLKVPVGTVKSRLNRARAAFAREFADYVELFGVSVGQRPGADRDEG
jgi:RNA polymerase sigma-70 factor (ECF subfamily)